MLLRDYIGNALHNERTTQGRTLRDVSKKSIMSLGYLSELERGKKEVSSEMLTSICNALYITLPELMIDIAVAMQKDSDKEFSVELSTLDHKDPVNI